MNIKKWLKNNTHNLSGKTIAITGSTGGLAKQLVSTLASLNANLILINRSKNKAEQQIKDLKSHHPTLCVEFLQCDLANFENVKSITEILKQKHIDILFLAAGVYNVKRFKTDLGYDNIFQTNFISHYYIAKELLNNIKKVKGKIVAVSSIASNNSKLDENDIDFSNRKKHSKVYGNSKRFLTFALKELCDKEDVNLSIVHPGVTLTSMTNHYPKAINWLVKIGIKIIFPNVEQACTSLISGIFNSTNYHEWLGPKIFNIWGQPKKQKIKYISQDERKKIFDIAENIYNRTKSNLL